MDERFKGLEKENKILRNALEYCAYEDKYIGSFNCKVNALKKIRSKAKNALKKLDEEIK